MSIIEWGLIGHGKTCERRGYMLNSITQFWITPVQLCDAVRQDDTVAFEISFHLPRREAFATTETHLSDKNNLSLRG